MDLLAKIRSNVEALFPTPSYTGLVAVAKHLEVAAAHLERAGKGGADHLYSDVLLRCNRALHGMLHEVHLLFAEGREGPLHPLELDRFFLERRPLGERGSRLLERYLREWRDPSLSDQQFAPNAQDALLAFVDVASLYLVVLDEITDLLAYRVAKERSEETAQASTGGATLAERLIHLLRAFARTLPERGDHRAGLGTLTEVHLKGHLRGFLETVLPATSVLHEPPLQSPSGVLVPTFILAEENESVVLEVGLSATPDRAAQRDQRRRMTEQMMMYLLTSGIPQGMAALLSPGSRDLAQEEASFRLDGRVYGITTLLPVPVQP